MHTLVSEPMSESDKPKSEASVFVVTGLEFSTKTLHTLHWCGALFTAKKKYKKYNNSCTGLGKFELISCYLETVV